MDDPPFYLCFVSSSKFIDDEVNWVGTVVKNQWVAGSVYKINKCLLLFLPVIRYSVNVFSRVIHLAPVAMCAQTKQKYQCR